MADPPQFGTLGLVEVLDWTGAALNRVDPRAFFAASRTPRPCSTSTSLSWKPSTRELRKELGVWYTPPEIVQYMVARVDTVLREELGIADGLADPRRLRARSRAAAPALIWWRSCSDRA